MDGWMNEYYLKSERMDENDIKKKKKNYDLWHPQGSSKQIVGNLPNIG
jgi:hypothetical protein